MNYQITCFCGNRFLITDQQLAGTVNCPVCKRPLQPMVSTGDPQAGGGGAAPEPACATPVEADSDATKRCPFCGEVILAVAKKCKHCGEFLDRGTPADPAAPTTAPAAADVPPVFALAVSQWDNFWKYIICFTIVAIIILAVWVLKISAETASLVTAASVVAAFFAAWLLYLSAKNSRCFIRPTRIDTEVGILTKDINSLELFRITDMELKQGIIQRILGIGTIHITSSDPKAPELVLYQIPKARKVHKYLQDQIPVATRQRGAIFVEK